MYIWVGIGSFSLYIGARLLHHPVQLSLSASSRAYTLSVYICIYCTRETFFFLSIFFFPLKTEQSKNRFWFYNIIIIRHGSAREGSVVLYYSIVVVYSTYLYNIMYYTSGAPWRRLWCWMKMRRRRNRRRTMRRCQWSRWACGQWRLGARVVLYGHARNRFSLAASR